MKNVKEEKEIEEIEEISSKSKNKKKIIIVLVAIIVVAVITLTYVGFKSNWYGLSQTKTGEKTNKNNVNNNTNTNTDTNNNTSNRDSFEAEIEKMNYLDKMEYKESTDDLKSKNNMVDFDLAILKLENNNTNTVYSPLSIKYALQMLSEASNGNTKNQIDKLLNNANIASYKNSQQLSLANALFVNNNIKELVNNNYVKTINSKYNASVVFDSFEDNQNINKWISDNTFKTLQNTITNNVDSNRFMLINLLSMNMEWKKRIMPSNQVYYQDFKHEDYVLESGLSGQNNKGYATNFDNQTVAGLTVAAVSNNYDIVKKLGKDNIKKLLVEEYRKYLKENEFPTDKQGKSIPHDTEEQINTAVNKFVKEELDTFIEELNSNYGVYSRSTDFYFNDNDDIRVFAKDLRQYNDLRLQYIGIMPKNTSLNEYIENVTASDINKITTNLKQIKKSSFKEGYVNELKGTIPTFKYDYETNLIDDLKKLGVTDVFDNSKSDLKNAFTNNGYVDSLVHKTAIDFSNDGVKAVGATTLGGSGNDISGFEYKFEVPVNKIDLSFDKPYMYIIKDKDTGDTLFVGTVYNPNSCINNNGLGCK